MPYTLPAGGATSFALATGTPAAPTALPAGGAVDFGLSSGVVWPAYPGLTLRAGLGWGAAPAADRAATAPWGTAPFRGRLQRALWGAADIRQRALAALWGTAPDRAPPPTVMAWARGQPAGRAPAVPWGSAPRRERATRAPWDASAGPAEGTPRLPWGDPPPRQQALALPFQGTRRQPTPQAGGGDGPYALPATPAAGAPVDFALPAFGPTYALPVVPVDFALEIPVWAIPIIEPLPRDRTGVAPWGRAAWRQLAPRLPWGWGHSQYRKDTTISAVYPDTDDPLLDLGDGPGAEPAPQETYLAMNLVTVVRLPDETPLAVRDLSISLDVDSWAWAFSGTVIGAASLAAVAPTAQGLTDIRVTLNGHQWVFMVERYSQQQAHGDDRYTLHGVSRTQYLAAPYAPRRSKRNAAQINAVQAANEELLNTGFLLDWNYLPGDNTPDWTYPVGTFSYQSKTPAEVLKQIAASAGAVLIPLRALDRLRLQPRFRASPWALAGAYADAIVHWSQVTRQALEWRPAPLYNAAFVSGTHAGHGVEVTRFGTAGDAPAPDVFEDGVVAVDQARERGRQIIAASGNHAMVEIECAIPEATTAPGLIEPGDVLEFQGPSPAESWRGYVLGVRISAPGSGAISLKQTAQVIRFYEH